MRATTSMLPIAAAVTATITCRVIGLTPAAAQVAAPPAPARFGKGGQTVITSELALDYQRDVIRIEGAEPVTISTFDLHVGFDRVLAARLTLGARIGFEGALSGLDTRRRFDLGARFGGLVPLGRSTIWWPTLGLTYGLTSLADRDSTATIRTVTLVLSAPFLWQPERHLLIGLGPTYERDLQSKTGPDADQTGPRVAGFGVHGFVGLWF